MSESKSAPKMVTATAKKVDKMSGHEFNSKQAENGWTMNHRPPRKDDEMWGPGTDYVFETMESMHEKQMELAGEGKATGNKSDKSGKMSAADKKGDDDEDDD